MQRTHLLRTVHGLFLAAACLVFTPMSSAQEVVCGPDCELCGGRGLLGNGLGNGLGSRLGNRLGLGNGGDEVECRGIDYGRPDLFYNYYVDPTCSQTDAHLYLSPRPVPAHTGHTYITYQPLMPHQFLYAHHHTYQRYYDGGRGMTRAKVHYYSPPVRTAVVGAIHHFKIPR